jgi:hypothetical protein
MSNDTPEPFEDKGGKPRESRLRRRDLLARRPCVSSPPVRAVGR